MHQARNSPKLISSPVILPILNVVLIVQVFFFLTTISFRQFKPYEANLPMRQSSYTCGMTTYDWIISLDKTAQWWLKEKDNIPLKMSPEAIGSFIDTHEAKFLLFEIDQDTPYYILESVFAHLNSPFRGGAISFLVKSE